MFILWIFFGISPIGMRETPRNNYSLLRLRDFECCQYYLSITCKVPPYSFSCAGHFDSVSIPRTSISLPRIGSCADDKVPRREWVLNGKYAPEHYKIAQVSDKQFRAPWEKKLTATINNSLPTMANKTAVEFPTDGNQVLVAQLLGEMQR